MIERLDFAHLELGVLLSAEADGVASLDLARRDEPAPAILNEDEEEVESLGIKSLHDAVPTLIAAGGGQLHNEVIGRAVPAARGLDPDAKQPVG